MMYLYYMRYDVEPVCRASSRLERLWASLSAERRVSAGASLSAERRVSVSRVTRRAARVLCVLRDSVCYRENTL